MDHSSGLHIHQCFSEDIVKASKALHKINFSSLTHQINNVFCWSLSGSLGLLILWSMLNTPNQVLLDMHSNSFQDYFLHHLLEGKCEADLPADPWILHLALLEEGHRFFPVLRKLFWTSWAFKDGSMDLKRHQLLWILPTDLYGFGMFKCSVVWYFSISLLWTV